MHMQHPSPERELHGSFENFILQEAKSHSAEEEVEEMLYAEGCSYIASSLGMPGMPSLFILLCALSCMLAVKASNMAPRHLI